MCLRHRFVKKTSLAYLLLRVNILILNVKISSFRDKHNLLYNIFITQSEQPHESSSISCSEEIKIKKYHNVDYFGKAIYFYI